MLEIMEKKDNIESEFDRRTAWFIRLGNSLLVAQKVHDFRYRK